MKKGKLLSIGEFSKLSGASIKSLRYYDRIGVLPPAYINPQNSYRYYSINQLYLLDSIMLCIDMGIPLKELNNYVSDNGQTIHYGRLFEHGKILAKKKIAQIQKKLDMLSFAQHEIERSKVLSTKTSRPFHFERSVFIIASYGSNQSDIVSSDAFKEIMHEITRLNIPVSREAGVLRIFENGVSQKYLYVPIEPEYEDSINHTNTIVLPAGEYMCLECKFGDIDKADKIFPHIGNKKAVVLESEMFLQNLNANNLRYELKCIII